MTYLKITLLLFVFTISACFNSGTTEQVSRDHDNNPVDTNTPKESVKAQTALQDAQLAPTESHALRQQITELEKRRLEIEAKRLAAEEKRLAAAEKRLAAAEKRLAEEQQRLASEEQQRLATKEKKLIPKESITLKTDKTPLQEKNEKLKKAGEQPPQLVESEPVKKETKKLKSVVSTTKNPAFIKLENQYYLDLYKWELKTAIYRLVKYPDWAKSLGKSGNVSLDFTVNRNARVSNVSGENPNISIQLISELHRAIIAATKSILPPDALPGDSWNMSITYNFQPHEVEQVALQKPVKPVFLEKEHSTVLIDNDNNLEKYQKDVKEIISDQIEYPVWAEKLKQRGKVSFEIVINKDGSIAEIKPKDVNRHDFLNQEVLRAINESAPLPSIPEHLRLQTTNLIIQHEFKK